ncbi:ABC transporter ATP-binding protein [Brotaphodocola sp.]|uniref:ABC transporter ATP-binding protein n=1 Tax=Brotaphodocola sp. TaxID=3073577 RepID=UPI003D7D3CE4
MMILLRQIRQYKKDTLLTPLFAGLEVIMEVLLPFITAKIIDEGLNGEDLSAVYRYGALMVVMAMLSLLFGALAGKYAASASSGFACNLRESMYEKIQTFSFSNIDKFSTASLVTRMTTDITNVQNAFQMVIRIAVRAPMTLICSMVMCFVISPKLSLMFLVAIVFLAVVLFTIIHFATRVFNEVFERYDDLNASIQENVSAIRVVKAYVREDHENKKFRNSAQTLYRLFVKAEGLVILNNPMMMLVVYGCIIGISWFGAKFIVAGSMTTGELTSLFSYTMSLMMSLMMLSMIFVMLTMSMASIRRICEVLKETPDLQNPDKPRENVADGSIDFNHVSFAYRHGSGEDTLKDIDLHIRSGETIGIIGGTGSGKSSLVNLISRLYDATEGSVCVGGVDVREYDLEALRNQVSVVLQKNVLFSGTILENLRWGNENATREECIHACESACADEFIERFPDKYDTYLERGGVNVSGGQKQRLCIARALLKSPKVLILDDSTSAVDTATDAKIRRAFAEEIPGTTKLIIAQRISSVQSADRIVVLDNGKINGIGSHEELLASNEIYREIYESQNQNGSGDFDQNHENISSPNEPKKTENPKNL